LLEINELGWHPGRTGPPAAWPGAGRKIGVGDQLRDYDDFDLGTLLLIGNDLWRIVRRSRAEAALAQRLAEVTELKERLEDAHLQLLQPVMMNM
jgi:hypothetical protein